MTNEPRSLATRRNLLGTACLGVVGEQCCDGSTTKGECTMNEDMIDLAGGVYFANPASSVVTVGSIKHRCDTPDVADWMTVGSRWLCDGCPKHWVLSLTELGDDAEWVAW